MREDLFLPQEGFPSVTKFKSSSWKIMYKGSNAANAFLGLEYSYPLYGKAVKAYSFLKKDSPLLHFTIVKV